ncbi:MAG: hypothetical protein U0Q11_05170 [Vicinamibacterales bacterium]
MSFELPDILALVGRLDETPGFDAPRERFRRFLTERITDVASVRSLLSQCQQALGDQHERARHDLIVLLGVFLGFEVTFGGYEAPGRPARLCGHWRSRRHARLIVDVRSEQTAGDDIDELVQTVQSMGADAPPDLGERWMGLCVTTPFYSARRRLAALLAHRPESNIRCVTVDSLIWLAEMVTAGRLEHQDVLRLLMSGSESDFTIDLMRRVASGVIREAEPAAETSDTGRIADTHEVDRPVSSFWSETPGRLSIVANSGQPRDAEYWLANLASDESASPEQMVDFVIRGRQVLGITDPGPLPMPVRPGDSVCFYIAGTGIVGHAQFDNPIADAAAAIRGAGRFTSVFQLKNVSIYDAPHRVLLESLGLHVPMRSPYDNGAMLAPITREDFEALTLGPPGHERGRRFVRD